MLHKNKALDGPHGCWYNVVDEELHEMEEANINLGREKEKQ